MVEMGKEAEQKIQQMQLLEQNLQSFLMQRQQFQAQLAEIDSALKELKTSKKSYKIVGNIMVDSNKDDLEKELKKNKEVIELRIKALQKQEDSLRDKQKKIQKEVLSDIKKE